MSDVSGAGHWRPEVKIIRGKTIYELEGIKLRSCRLWLDAKGFHPFLDQEELTKPDLEKSMGCPYNELPRRKRISSISRPRRID